MVERLGIDKHTGIELTIGETEPGAVLQSQRVDVTRLIVDKIAGFRRRQRGRQVERAGKFLIDAVDAGIGAVLYAIGDLQPDIAVKAQAFAMGMVPVAIGMIVADSGPHIASAARCAV